MLHDAPAEEYNLTEEAGKEHPKLKSALATQNHHNQVVVGVGETIRGGTASENLLGR